MAKSSRKNLQNSQKSIDHVVFADLFPTLTKPKGRMRALSILQAAIESYQEFGIERTTYERIAEKAKISRPLIFTYFRDYDEIFHNSVKYIRVHFQMHAVEALSKENTMLGKLRAYVLSTFDWIEKFPSYASGLLLYLHRCSWDERNRELNTHFAQAGQARIAAMIQYGIGTKEFQPCNPQTVAKQIQTLIAGSMITYACETIQDKNQYRTETLDLCLGLVGVKAGS